MNNKFSFSIFVLLAVIILSPLTSHAYGTSQQTAVRLSDTHVLFTITYKLGFLNRSSSLPLLANTTSPRDISFSIVDQDDKVMVARTNSIILADNYKLKNNRYFLPEGRSSNFTLVTVAELFLDDTRKYSLETTRLPFITIDDNNVARMGEVDKNALKEFKTPFVK